MMIGDDRVVKAVSICVSLRNPNISSPDTNALPYLRQSLRSFFPPNFPLSLSLFHFPLSLLLSLLSRVDPRLSIPPLLSRGIFLFFLLWLNPQTDLHFADHPL